MTALGTRGRVLVAAASALVLLAVAVLWALTRSAAEVEVDPAASLTAPGVVVRDTRTGRLAVVRPDGSRGQTAATCSRVHAAGGRAVCLRPDPSSPSTFVLDVLGPDLAVQRTLPVNGVPTRARISADGRVVAWTVFVSGDSYTSSGFSTRSGILDLETGVLTTSLEDFSVSDEQGRAQKPPADANFWGVSFADDDNTFYATMATGAHFYLVQGDFAAETVTVLADGVECPSLSPDGTRLVYKRRLPNLTWRLEVYDLGSGRRTALAEPATVDDQGAWLDDATIAYGRLDPATGQVGVWTVPADGSGAPALLAEDAESPSGRVPG
ncbi:WD40-like Beta Propeller Repeat [Friedmanniella luteola]|uniref:WD40-like Beta Propeller Repeat n=1 Tax=Friedmanniella luteola TaxID=546871 RepID=A0A1H1UKW9_9ACTN|nr:PD40 domain-containing protein [Friedmanniella luteola]SDS72951.1 WD40-like Beta Propeller Repeat [Friedmanniella luteola]